MIRKTNLFPRRLRFAFVSVCYLIVFVAVALFSSCTCKRSNTLPEAGGKAVVPVKIHIERLEKDLFALSPDSVAAAIPGLKAKYGEFFDLFNYKIVQLGSTDNPKYAASLKSFITDYYMNVDYNRVMKVYPTLEPVEKELSDAFTRYHAFFPDKRIPRVYSCVSGWNQSVVTTDTLIGIGLDKYLGSNCDLYEKLQLDKYLRYTMQREYIVPDCLRDWGYTEFDAKDTLLNVLSNVLYEGKILYFEKQLLPDASDTILFGYTPAQLKWCQHNVSPMWTYLVEHKMLFSTEMLTIRKLIYPAPFTNFFTKESPGRAVVWLGYEIIASYMKHNPEVTLSQLMKDQNYQEILRKSQFKP